MIRFNLFDFGMEAIQAEAKLYNLDTKNNVWVYGTRNDTNPVVRIRYNSEGSLDLLKGLANLFEPNGIQVVLEKRNTGKADYTIGLRKDLRAHALLAAGVIQTIIYALEGKLRVPKSYKLAKVPNLPPFGVAPDAPPVGMPTFTPKGAHDFPGFLWQNAVGEPIWAWNNGAWGQYVPNQPERECPSENPDME